MNIQELHRELTSRSIVLTLDGAGKMQCKAPKGAITPALADAMKTHKAALLAALADTSTVTTHITNNVTTNIAHCNGNGNVLSSNSRIDTPPALRLARKRVTSCSHDELTLWAGYYARAAWYGKNEHQESPFSLALEYATNGHDGLAWLLATNSLIWFYELCQPRAIHTSQGLVSLEPRQFTELLRSAYLRYNVKALAALASNFMSQDRLDETVAYARKLFAPSTEHQPDEPAPASTEHQPDEPAPARTPGRRRSIVYADVSQGRAITDAGVSFSFTAGCSLSELLETIHQAHTCDRLYICGQLPDAYASWLTDAAMWSAYTTGKRGHYFDKDKEENHVARYARRVSGAEIEVRSLYSWLGDTDYTVEQAQAAMSLLEQYLVAAFNETARAYATPALTFQQLFLLLNRIEGKHFAPLPDDIRALITGKSGQGRIELCTPDNVKTLPGLHYYDGVFMYSALTWSMPTELATHDYQDVYAGKTPARYRIRYTVPSDWQHIGLFMTPKEQLTGREHDSLAWCYPGSECQGRTFETWADGAELDVLIDHYSPAPVYAPDATKEQIKAAKEQAYQEGQKKAFPAWTIEILERIVFKPEKDSSSKKPLDTITNRLARMRDKIEQDARQDTTRTALYKLVRGAVRNILLHGIGSFNRHVRDVTYILQADEPAPDGYTGRRDIDESTVWYTVPQDTETYTQQFEHPEWAALIWARCRARMARAALQLPRETIIAIRTDAIAVSTEQPQWLASEKRGSLRQKWSITRTLKAPHDFNSLDALVSKYVGDK